MRWGFRVASRPEVGRGHLARTAALAGAMNDDVTFFLDPGADAPPLPGDDYPVVTESRADGIDRLAVAADVDALLFDGYGFDSDAVAAVSANRVSVQISDGGPPLPTTLRLMHGFLEPAGADEFGGPAFALLGPGTPTAEREMASVEDGPPHLLIGFGAVDSANLTGRVLEALSLMSTPVTATVILPESAPHFDRVNKQISNASNVTYENTAPTPPDLTIGAAGVSLLERAADGIPSLIITQNTRQRANAEGAVRHGVAGLIGDAATITAADIAAALDAALSDRAALHAMGRRCREVVDGNGAHRAARHIEAAARAYMSAKVRAS